MEQGNAECVIDIEEKIQYFEQQYVLNRFILKIFFVFVFRRALYIHQRPVFVNAPIEECPVCILPFSTQRLKEKHILRNVTSYILILTIYLYFTSS